MASLRISDSLQIKEFTGILTLNKNPKIAAVFKYAQIDSDHLIFSYLCIF